MQLLLAVNLVILPVKVVKWVQIQHLGMQINVLNVILICICWIIFVTQLAQLDIIWIHKYAVLVLITVKFVPPYKFVKNAFQITLYTQVVYF